MHIPVLQREVWPFPEPIAALILRYEFLWSIQSFCRAGILIVCPFGSRRNRSVSSSGPPDGLLGGLILFPRDEVILPLTP